VKIGIIADIHGNDVALRAVLKDASRFGVDCWWALGDLVLFGPRPAEVLELLHGLPGIKMLRGNTDRYVLTGEQPAPMQPSPTRP
jgi:predicted phosphodiesterase